MRILMCAFACEPDKGSEPEVGWKWAQVMAEANEVMVVTQAKNRAPIDRWHQQHPGNQKNISYSYLELGPVWRWLKKRAPGGMYLYYTVWQWRLRAHVAGLLRRQDFDLIHHVTFASFRMPVWAGGKPVLWGPVGGAETAPMHLVRGYGTLAGRMREHLRNLSTRIAGHLVGFWEPTRRSGGMALASTPATAAILERNQIRCMLMPTIGHDADPALTGTRRSDGNAPLRVLFVGRLHLLKGVHLLLRALAQIESGKVNLTIVGDGPERKRLLELANRLGLGPVVSFRGQIPRAMLDEVFAAHDVVAAPSLYESGGLSVLEGFAHGLPAIVLDCGGHALSVGTSCGFRIKTTISQMDVIHDLADAIMAYCNDRKLCEAHGNEARRTLKRNYSWERKRSAMQQVYNDLNTSQENRTSR